MNTHTPACHMCQEVCDCTRCNLHRAAPALLEALEGALQVAMVAEAGNARSLDWTGIVRDIRAAVAQAKGESHA